MRITPLALIAFLAACSSAVRQPSQSVPELERIRRNAGVADALALVSPTRMEEYLTRLVGFGTRHTMSDTLSQTRGIGAARRYIFETFEQFSRECGGCLDVYYDSHDVVNERAGGQTVTLRNVVARLKGRSDPSRVIVLMGHYDSCVCNVRGADPTADAPGANDDGSGTVQVMELARVFSQKFPQGLDATLMFVPVAGEENGLLGSTALAERLLADRALRVQAAFTTDVGGNIFDPKGNIDSVTMRVFAAEPEDGGARQLARFVKIVGEAYVPNFTVRVIQRLDRIGRGGDHRPFWDRGVPAVRISESFEDHRHQHLPEDKLNFVDYSYMQKLARVSGASAAHIALAPPPPDSLQMTRNTRVSGRDFILRWRAPRNAADLAGYEITVRPTTEYFPSRVIPVGNVREFSLEDTQADDLWIGIRSVDRDGNRSPTVSFHTPERLPQLLTRPRSD